MKKKRPDDVTYSEAHLWVRMEEFHTVLIGVTDYLIKDWDEVTELKLPEESETLEQNTPFGELISEIGSITLISPVSGEISEINPAVQKNPNLALEDPYEDGWLLKIHLNDPSELESLLDLDAYTEMIEEMAEPADEEEAQD